MVLLKEREEISTSEVGAFNHGVFIPYQDMGAGNGGMGSGSQQFFFILNCY